MEDGRNSLGHAWSPACIALNKIDTGLLEFFSEPDMNYAIAEYLADLGELTGAELFAMKSGKNRVPVTGVEDSALYRRSF